MLATKVVDLGLTSLGASVRLRLRYYTGTLPTLSTVLFTGECFISAIFLHAQDGGEVTIEEADGSSAFVRDLALDKATPFRYAAENTTMTAYRMDTGLRVWSEKANVHCQIRCFELLDG